MVSECVRPKELADMAGVRPQMIHNYISAGRIPVAPCEPHKGTRCIAKNDAQAWLDVREAKAKAKYEEIQRQLRGEV